MSDQLSDNGDQRRRTHEDNGGLNALVVRHIQAAHQPAEGLRDEESHPVGYPGTYTAS